MAGKQNESGLALQELKAELKAKTPGRLYFFHGEEVFLLRHYTGQLKKLLVEPLTESFNYHKLTAETFDLDVLADCVENLPMMAQSTLVCVDEIDIFKFNEGDREKVISVISDIPEYCTVVFCYGTTPWKPDKRLKKLYEAVTKYGKVVEFCKQERRDLVPWIIRHFAANGKQISQELCLYLIDITGGTMTALAGEIAKICAYSGADAICKSDIDAVTEPVLDAVVFDMTELMSSGQYGKAMLKLDQLKKMQQEPLAILGAIGLHFRKLGAAKMLRNAGKNSGDMMRLYGGTEYGAKRTMDAAGRFSSAFYEKASKLILDTDYQIKTSGDDPDRLIELLVMKLAQEARNG